jgi:integrase
MQVQDPKAPARRVRVAKHPGIYYRETPAGRRYEITFLDSDGRRRWQTIDGGLREAEAALGELRSRLHRGERVAPTKITFAELAETWLENQRGKLRPKTITLYDGYLQRHVLPRLGRLRVIEITVDDVARLIGEMQRGIYYEQRAGRFVKRERKTGYAAWTIRGVITVLGRVLGHAARRGLIPENPVRKLERGERPRVARRDLRVLDRDEIGRLLDQAPHKYRTLLATAVFTGLRQGELLGLTWQDLDLTAGLVRVRRQLDRQGQLVEPKTSAAKRDVELMASLVAMLKQHKQQAFAHGRAKPADFVFASEAGTPLGYRNIARRGLEPALNRAGLIRRVRWHDLRHAYASLLIAQGANVGYVARQLGHTSARITLDVYQHEFDRAEHGQRTRDALEASFGHLLR